MRRTYIITHCCSARNFLAPQLFAATTTLLGTHSFINNRSRTPFRSGIHTGNLAQNLPDSGPRRPTMPAITAFDVSIDLYLRGLRSLKAMLDKASSPVRAAKSGTAVPQDLVFNAQCCVNLAAGGLGLLTQKKEEKPEWHAKDTTLHQIISRVDRAIALLEEGAKPADSKGFEERTLEVTYGNGQKAMWGGREYILGYGIPNFMFHLCMTYSSLKSHGVEVGKTDYLMPFMAGMAPSP